MFQKLDEVENRYEELEKLLTDPKVLGNPKEMQKLARERAGISKLVETYRAYKKVEEEIKESHNLLTESDEEMRELAKAELHSLKERQAALEEEIKTLLLPQDPRDDKNIFLEIRAGTGGEEAALFAADLFRMYAKFAEMNRWRVEVMSQNPTGLGGFKEIIALIEGKKVYSRLKYESGVHRVQRVPVTESSGRIHTSAVTVAVLPEADEVEVEINPNDLRIDVYRSSGPGGQSVNTTDSAVRVTHIPTGLVVTCQDEKSQHKNKAKALKVLRARLLDQLMEEQHNEISEDRKSQVGSGDRSERVRTYNFPQNRITDHRLGLTLHRLDSVLEGDLAEVVDVLNAHFQAEALKSR
ncbi:MAG: peptide chain release factor 1 [Deltaproteobacteria bacterium]|nr:peptide chain release factor 1 [Deltaproteobacteria bacterium]MDO9211368.1 peptide chain release factor 1 [Deltaproteobacteria bacterium]